MGIAGIVEKIMAEQKQATASARGAEIKTKDVGFIRDGSSASRAIPPGDSEPGWDDTSGKRNKTHVVHSTVKPYQ